MKRFDLFTATYITAICFVFTGAMFIATYVWYGNVVHPTNFKHVVLSPQYSVASNSELYSYVVNDTVEFCKMFKGKDLVECSVNIVSRKFNYTDREVNTSEYYLILESDKLNETGYLCRDIVIVYDAVFKRLGYFTDYVYTDNHVYNAVYGNGFDCQINMDRWHCW